MVKKTGHEGLVQRDVTFTRNGKKITQKRWVKPGEDDPVEPKGKKEIPKSKGSFNIGDTIKFMGKDLTVEKVSESQQTTKLSNGKIYTFNAINKGKSIKGKKTIKDLKINKEKLKKSEIINFGDDGFVFKSQLNKSKIVIKLNKSDKKKRQDENDTVDEMQKWLQDQQDRLEDELVKLYPEL